MDDQDYEPANRFPTPEQPLLGLTLLVVEDSRFACNALRLMSLRSGARIRRADSLAAADRHLRIYRPAVLIVDLGLPDGDGGQLIATMHAKKPRIEVILGTSGHLSGKQRALALGADGFLTKPFRSLASFQELILSLLPEARRPLGPRIVNEARIRPDRAAYQEDLRQIAQQLDDTPDDRQMDYLTHFLTGLSHSAGDTPLFDAGQSLVMARMRRAPTEESQAAVMELLQERLRDDALLQPRI